LILVSAENGDTRSFKNRCQRVAHRAVGLAGSGNVPSVPNLVHDGSLLAISYLIRAGWSFKESSLTKRKMN